MYSISQNKNLPISIDRKSVYVDSRLPFHVTALRLQYRVMSDVLNSIPSFNYSVRDAWSDFVRSVLKKYINLHLTEFNVYERRSL